MAGDRITVCWRAMVGGELRRDAMEVEPMLIWVWENFFFPFFFFFWNYNAIFFFGKHLDNRFEPLVVVLGSEFLVLDYYEPLFLSRGCFSK